MRRAVGSSTLEYLGLVGCVAIVIGGLLVLREHTVGRRAPVRPVPVLERLLDVLRDEPPRVRTTRVRPRPAPRRPARPRPTVEVPDWLVR
jgi:hypothetical protein